VKTAIAHLKSISPYSQSRAHQADKLNRETGEEYEERTWREKCHVDSAGYITIPPMAFKQGLDRAAQMLGLQIPGKGKTTYTKFFLSGVMCIDPLTLPEKAETVRGERIHANVDGKRGSGKRVFRTFPCIDEWRGNVTFHVIADEITQDVFERVLAQSGSFVGIGRFRPENGGYFGRFKIEKVEWTTG
jgi:hypothetical protein